jgi:hypothetical protein
MATAGKTSVGGTEDFDSTNDGDIQGPYTVGAGSTITEFHAYLRSTGAGATDPKFRPLVYADNAGEPGALIATLPEITIALADTTGAWRDITGLSVSTGANAAIWIGLWFNGVNHRYVYDTPGGNTSRYDAAMLTYSSSGDAPSSWDTAGDTPATQEKSLYVVYSGAVTQKLRPDADVTTTGWTSTPLWSKIEETSADGTVITATAS